MRRALITLCSILALSAGTPAIAADDPWAGVDVMSDSEMSDMRGGLAIAPGLDVEFGATVTTFSNGAPVLQTELTWAETGVLIENTYGNIGVPISTLSPEARAALGIQGAADANGVVIADSKGVTALIHNLNGGSLQNIILNSADGRDLRQEINVTMALPNFEAMSHIYNMQRIGLRIDSELATSLINATR